MSRPLRIQYPKAWYHVMSRGRCGEVVFLEEKDCLEFINLLKEACRIKAKVDNEPRADLTPILNQDSFRYRVQ
jgi:hypothetical protein